MKILERTSSELQIEIARRDLVALRNALCQLCNGAEFPVGDPELATITGFERSEIQRLLDKANLALASRSVARTADGFVEWIAGDGQQLVLNLSPDDFAIFRQALGQAGYVHAGNLWNERGGSFSGLRPADVVMLDPGDFERRIGISEKECDRLRAAFN